MNNSWKHSLTHLLGCCVEAESFLCLEIPPSPNSKSAIWFWFLLDSRLVGYNSSVNNLQWNPHPTQSPNTYVPNRLLSVAAERQKLQLQKISARGKRRALAKIIWATCTHSCILQAFCIRSPVLMPLSNPFSDCEASSLRQFSNTSPGKPNLWQPFPPSPHSHLPGWFQLFRRRW